LKNTPKEGISGIFIAKTLDIDIAYSITWISVSRYDQLREIIAEFGKRLGQESMYLERAEGSLDFVEPGEDESENKP